MNAIIEVKKNGVSALSLYKSLEVKTPFSMWIGRKITDYGFKENVDFVTFLLESGGGRPLTDYILTVDMAKELAIVEKTEKGRLIRKYLIEVENKYKQQLLRDSTKETRRGLTDIIQDSGENERMHGHGFSTYTKLIYKKLGIEYTKQDNFRDSLQPDQLKVVKTLEHLAEGYLRLGYDYAQIKNVLPECITAKQAELDGEQ
jgi:phage anti-repressor protein